MGHLCDGRASVLANSVTNRFEREIQRPEKERARIGEAEKVQIKAAFWEASPSLASRSMGSRLVGLISFPLTFCKHVHMPVGKLFQSERGNF
jgi:hypothetical protein